MQLRCGPQESSWGEVLRRCALSLAAVATVSAPIMALPQEVGPLCVCLHALRNSGEASSACA